MKQKYNYHLFLSKIFILKHFESENSYAAFRSFARTLVLLLSKSGRVHWNGRVTCIGSLNLYMKSNFY